MLDYILSKKDNLWTALSLLLKIHRKMVCIEMTTGRRNLWVEVVDEL
jgi:hypothetical protein